MAQRPETQDPAARFIDLALACGALRFGRFELPLIDPIRDAGRLTF